MSKVLTIKGWEELLGSYDKVSMEAPGRLAETMSGSLVLLEGILKDYPEQPSRTRAKSFNTYVRGVGRFPRSAFVEGHYSAKAFRKSKRRGQVKMTSEKLGSRWTHKVDVNEAEIVGYLGNSASYADWVEGDKQAKFHEETGWPTIDSALDKMEEVIILDFEKTVEGLLDIVGGRYV